MGLGVRNAQSWRTRSRAGIALVVLTAWFGSLLAAAPFTSPASAAPADPATWNFQISGPASPGADATPTWNFTLPADSTTGPDPAPLPSPLPAGTDSSDTATATIEVTHRGECSVGTTAPGTFASCTDAAVPPGAANEFSFTSSALTADDSYTFYVRDVETTTTTTTVYHADGSTTPIVDGPNAVTGSPASSGPYVYDGTGPSLAFDVGGTPPSQGTDPTPTWAWTAGADAASVECALTDDTTPAQPPVITPNCTSPYTPTLAADATYKLTVTAKDALLNPSQIFTYYTLVSAGVPGVSVAPTTGSTTTPTWTLTPPAGTTPTDYSVVLSGPGVPAGSPVAVAADPTTHTATYSPDLSASYSPDPDAAHNGTWTLKVTATVDGRPSAQGSADYILDTINPAVTIMPASSATVHSSATPGWTVNVADADTSPTVTCAVTPTPSNNPGTNCAAYETWTAPNQDTWTLTATATDAAGNTTSKSSTWIYDVAPAAPIIVTPTPATGNGATVTWTVSTEATATLTCTATGPGGFTASSVSSPADFACPAGTNQAVTVTLPAGPNVDGNYYLTVRATDAGGSTQTSTDPLAPYVLDRTPPGTPTFDPAGSSGSQNTPGVFWPFTASGASVKCQLMQGPAPGTTSGQNTPCTSPYTTNLPSPGEWWLRVTARDAAGNSASADSAHVIYDTTPPAQPTLTRNSSSPTSDHATSWTIGTTESSGATLLCSWTGPAGYTVAETACPAAYSFTLPAANGTYTLSVVVRDAATNRSTAKTGTVVIDDIAPVVTFTNPPTSPRRDPTVTWTTTVTETGSGAVKTECQLVKRTSGSVDILEPWTTVSCGLSVTRTLTAGDGVYYLQVRVTDAAGNVTANGTTSADVELDTSAPGAPTVSGSQGFSQDPNASWTITPPTVVDPTAVYDCRLVKDNVTAGTTWVPCDTDATAGNGIVFTTTLSTDGTYVLEVVARDPAGNLSDPVATSNAYTLDRVKPAAPIVTTTENTSPTGYVSSNTAPVWSITGEADATFACTWTTTITPVPAGMPADGPCGDVVNPYSPTLPADGFYTLHVTQSDQALNTSATSTDVQYQLDTAAPVAPVFTGEPVSPSKNKIVQYGFTAEPGTRTECRLLYVTGLSVGSPGPITGRDWAACSSPWSPALDQGDGRYQVEVRATDAADNVGTVAISGIYVLDTIGPLAPVFQSQPTGTANQKDRTWTWTGETPSTGSCTLYRTPVGSTTAAVVVGPTACDSQTFSANLTYGDGLYRLTVQLTDPTLNAGAIATSADYNLDATPPGAPTVSGPSGTSNKTAVDYAITSSVEPLATAECKLTRDVTTVVSDWATCTMPRTVNLSGDGSYVLEVRLTDQYNNTGPAGASPAYLLDTKLPTIPVVTAPASPSSNGAPSFSFVTDADTRTTCRLTRGAVVAIDTTSCTSPFTASLTGQPDGDYVLLVTAADPAGNQSSGSSVAYTYDTTKPVAPVVSGPEGPSQQRNPFFSWTGESGARPECSLQEKAGTPTPWVACATPYAPTLTADGSWVLSVRLIDAAGNVGDPGQSGAYLLDTTAPLTPGVTAPPSPGRDLAPSWSASTEEGSHTDCRLSGPGQLGSWSPCTLPMTTPISLDGTYTLEVRATDVAGNQSAVGSASYVLDTTAPAAPVVTQPTSPARSRTPSVTFTTEPGTTGICKLTRGSTVLSDAAPCASPTTLNLTGLNDGAYTLTVRAIDAAGNIGPAGTAAYVLDTTAPAAPTWTLIAGSPSSDRAPSFGFNVDLGTTPSCHVTLPSGAVRDLSCVSPVTLDLSGATDGDYDLAVRTTDAAGNASAAATTTYHLDSNAPAAPKLVGPPSPGSNRNPVWKISSTKPAECRVLRGTTAFKDWTPCGTSYSLDLFAQPDAVYYLEARVIGTTAATMSRYRLDTTGPAAATIVGPPSPSTDRRPTWAVSSPDTTVHAECRVMVFTAVLRDWAACGVSPAGSLYSMDLTGLGDGTYSLLVRLTDAAGNIGPVATSDYVLDTSAPAAVGVIAPPSPGNDRTPTWTLTSAAGVKLECRLSSGQKVISDFAPCTGEFTADLTGLPDGTYTLTVHALSAAGTPGPDTTSGYILDTTAAAAAGTLSGPTGPSRNRAPKWTFTIAPGTTAMCKVTFAGKVFRDGPCTSPFTLDLSNAADGTYTLSVRLIDAAGNESAPSTAGYILKTTPPPTPVLTMQPGSPSSTTDPTWGFSLSRGTSGQCRLLQAGNPLEDWSACGTPGLLNGRVSALLSGKPDGRYTMQIRAIDEAQNTSAAVAGDYVFDRSAAPLAVFVDTPLTPSNDTTPTWIIAAPPADTAVATTPTGTAALVRAAALTGTPQTECRLTTPRGAGSWAPCSGSYVATTNGDGTYLLEVRAYDTAGERGPASSSSYLLDTKVPAAPRLVDPMPPAVGNDTEVVWSWADDGNLVQCHLLRNNSSLGGFTACDLLYVANVGKLGEATYTVEARAVDAAGNVSPVMSDSYRYDITAPAAPVFTAKPASRGSASSVAWTFAVPVDTRATCVITRNGTVVSEGFCAGAFTLDLHGQQPATWVLSVHLVDTAGNAGPATTGSYTLLSAIGRGRVSEPGSNGSGSGPGGSGSDGSSDSGGGPDVSSPAIDREQPRAGALRIPTVVKKTIKKVARATGAIPGAVPGTDVPRAIKKVLGQTITKPQLPLALFVIVLLFLLVQNRIDRRDPKLAVAPTTAEPELTFGPILRPGGVTV